MLTTIFNETEQRLEWACSQCGLPSGFEAGTVHPSFAFCEACYRDLNDLSGDCPDCGSAGTCTCEEDD